MYVCMYVYTLIFTLTVFKFASTDNYPDRGN